MSEPKFNIAEKKPTTNAAALKKTKTTPIGTPHGTPGGKGRKRIKQEDVVGDEMLEMLKLEMGKEETEEELFGKTVAKNLARLPPFQRRIARQQIGQVLFNLEFEQGTTQNHFGHGHQFTSSFPTSAFTQYTPPGQFSSSAYATPTNQFQQNTEHDGLFLLGTVAANSDKHNLTATYSPNMPHYSSNEGKENNENKQSQ